MKTLTEGALRFDFDDRWTVLQYDGPDPGDYRSKLMPLEDTKAVDFVAVCKNADGQEHFYCIEIKDYRDQPRPNQRDLAVTVAQKTRDTVAGIVGFSRTSNTPHIWAPFIQALARRRTPVTILFWLEERHLPGPPQRRIQRTQVQIREIQRRLKWLTTKVIVTGRGLGGVPDGLTVSDVPAQAQP